MMRHCTLSALLAAVAMSAAQSVMAQAPAACSGAQYAQFDFWLGAWSVVNDGKPAGTNRIEKVLDGCALLETWRSVGKHRGHSLTFYDAGRELWHQTWIDVAGQPLYLDGRLRDGAMQLEGTRRGEKGATVKHRIIWTPLGEGRVRQHWMTSQDAGRTWTVAFDGLYERRTPDA